MSYANRSMGKGVTRNMPLKGESLMLDGGVRSTPRPGHFTPDKDPIPIVQEVG
jgi:hypothetical protein